jgi:hypothetical protein
VSVWGGYDAAFTDRSRDLHQTRVTSSTGKAVDLSAAGITATTVVDGLYLSDTSSTPSSDGIVAVQGGSPVLSSNVVEASPPCNSSRGVVLRGASGAQVLSNEIRMGDCGFSYGIDITSGSSSIRVSRNRIVAGVGISMGVASAEVLDNTLIHNAHGTNNTLAGIWADSGARLDARGNVIEAGATTSLSSYGIYLLQVDQPARIAGNRIHGGNGYSSWAVYIAAGVTAEVAVLNNLLHSGSGRGVNGADDGRGCVSVRSPGAIVTNNTCFVPPGPGFSQAFEVPVGWSAGGTFTNNLVFGVLQVVEKEICSGSTNCSEVRSFENNALLGTPSWAWGSQAESAGGASVSSSTPGDLEARLCAAHEVGRGNLGLALAVDAVLVSPGGADGDLETLADNDWRLRDDAPASLRSGGKDASKSTCGTTGLENACATGGAETCGGVTTDFAGVPRTAPFSIGAFENDAP